MKLTITIFTLSFIILIIITGCTNTSKVVKHKIISDDVDLTTHKLRTYLINNNKKYLIIFESGLGDDSSIWRQHKLFFKVADYADVLIYDRAGYGKSTINKEPRTIEQISLELDSIVKKYANGRKVILVGHSLGGMIVRDYAVKHKDNVAAILFVDPAHEHYNKPTQEIQDQIYNILKKNLGANHGATLEAKELINDSKYMAVLSDLPNVPVTVLTSMKTDSIHNEADRKLLYEAHEKLKSGVSDFTHIPTTKSSHYIMLDEPDLVIREIHNLILKLN